MNNVDWSIKCHWSKRDLSYVTCILKHKSYLYHFSVTGWLIQICFPLITFEQLKNRKLVLSSTVLVWLVSNVGWTTSTLSKVLQHGQLRYRLKTKDTFLINKISGTSLTSDMDGHYLENQGTRACGRNFNIKHVLTFKKGGFIILRHNRLRDITVY